MQEKNRTTIVKGSLRVWRATGLAACLVWLACGCETVQDYSLSYKVWDNDDFRKWSEPSSNPRLALFETPDHTKVLVAYDAYSEKHSVIKRQAYYLAPNQARIGAGKAPRFVPPVGVDGMQPIPVFAQSALATNLPAGLTNYAALSESGREFTLHPQAEFFGSFQLPVYPESSGTAVRIALTPFAAAGDTVMIGLVASAVAVILACESGFGFAP
jgi:hypothetical protein